MKQFDDMMWDELFNIKLSHKYKKTVPHIDRQFLFDDVNFNYYENSELILRHEIELLYETI